MYHLKESCPKLKCFYCGNQGHIKRKCWKYELHIAIQELRRQTAENQKKTPNKTKRIKQAIDRMKEVTFRQEGKDFIMCHKGQDLAIYIDEQQFQEIRGYFEPTTLPKWQLDKVIKITVHTNQLKIYNHLPFLSKNF